MNINKDYDFSDEEDLDELDVEDYEDDNFNENYDGDFGGGSMPPMDKYQDLLKGLTDFELFLKTIIAEWVGLRWDAKKEKYELDSSIKPIMNYKCAKWCITFLRPYARGSNLLTQLRKDEYNDMMDDIEETAILSIGTRSKEFQLRSDSDIKLVYNQLIHISSLVLLGAGGDKNYKDFFSKSVNRNETVNMSPQAPIDNNNKRGIISRGIKGIIGGQQ